MKKICLSPPTNWGLRRSVLCWSASLVAPRRSLLHQARNQPARLRFGPFEVDRLEGRLYKRGVPLRLENHPFQVLLALLDRPDDIVTREELQQQIWGDGTNVGFEDGLNTAR